MLSIFRVIAILEGISYLALVGFTMPLKYAAKILEPNLWVGYAHGVLFIAYFALLIVVTFILKWNLKRFFLLSLAAFLPFGTFYAEKRLFKTALFKF